MSPSDPSSKQAAIAPIPEHLHAVTPRLVVSDGAGAIEFYRKAFGAQEIGERFTGPDGEIIHAELRIGDSIVMITDEGATPSRRARRIRSGGSSARSWLPTGRTSTWSGSVPWTPAPR
jgi:PhnB protein